MKYYKQEIMVGNRKYYTIYKVDFVNEKVETKYIGIDSDFIGSWSFEDWGIFLFYYNQDNIIEMSEEEVFEKLV